MADTPPTAEEIRQALEQSMQTFQALREVLGLPPLTENGGYSPEIGRETLEEINTQFEKFVQDHAGSVPAGQDDEAYLRAGFVDSLTDRVAGTPLRLEVLESAANDVAGLLGSSVELVGFLNEVYVVEQVQSGYALLQALGGEAAAVEPAGLGAAIEQRLTEVKEEFEAGYTYTPPSYGAGTKEEQWGKYLEKRGIKNEDAARQLVGTLKDLTAAGVYTTGQEPDSTPAATPLTLDAATTQALEVLEQNKVFEAMDVPRTNNPAADFAAAKEKFATLLGADGPLTAEQMGQQIEEFAQSGAFNALKAVKTVPMAVSGLLNSEQYASLVPEAIKNNPDLLFNIMADGARVDVIAALTAVESGIARAQGTAPVAAPAPAVASTPADPSTTPEQASVFQAVGEAMLDIVVPPAAAAPAPPAATPPATPPATTPAATPPVTQAQTVDPATISALERELTKIGLNPGTADGIQDNDFNVAAVQLRTAIYAIAGKTPPDEGTGVTAAQVQEMNTDITAFKKTQAYEQIKALAAGQVPPGLTDAQKEQIKVFDGLKSNPAQYAQAVITGMVATVEPDDAEGQKLAAMWEKIPDGMKANLPAVVDLLENNQSQLIVALEGVYDTGAPVATVTTLAPQSGDGSQQSGDLAQATINVQMALGMLTGEINALAGKQSFINIKAEDLGFKAPKIDGNFNAETQDATYKAVMALKWGVLGGEGIKDGTYNKVIGQKLKEEIMTGEGMVAAQLREKLNIGQMGKDEYTAREKKLQEHLRAGGKPENFEGNNNLDLLVYSLDIIHDSGAYDNDLAKRTTNANMMMDVAYDQFISKMPWLKDWLQDMFTNTPVGQFMGTMFEARGLEVSRLWGEKPEQAINYDRIKPTVMEFYNKNIADIQAKHPDWNKAQVHAELRNNIDDLTSGTTWWALKKLLKGTPEQIEASVGDALTAAENAPDGQAAEVFANTLIAAANEQGANLGLSDNPQAPEYDGLEEYKYDVGRKVEDDALAGHKIELISTSDGSTPDSPSEFGNLELISRQTYGRQVGNAGNAAPEQDAAGPVMKFERIRGNILQLSVTGTPDGNTPDRFIYQLAHEWDTTIPGDSRVAAIHAFMTDAAPVMGLSVDPKDYAEPRSTMTPYLRLGMAELLVRAQLDNGVPVDQLTSDFTPANINMIQAYVDKKMEAALGPEYNTDNTIPTPEGLLKRRADEFAGVLHELQGENKLNAAMGGRGQHLLTQQRIDVVTPQRVGPAAHIGQLRTIDATEVRTLFGGAMGEVPEGNNGVPPYHLTSLYQRSVSVGGGTGKGHGIREHGFMLTRLDPEDARRFDADMIVTTLQRGEQIPTHFLINFQKDGVADPAVAGSPGKPLNSFLGANYNEMSHVVPTSPEHPSPYGPDIKFEVYDANQVFNRMVGAPPLDIYYADNAANMRRHGYEQERSGYGMTPHPGVDRLAQNAGADNITCNPKLQVRGPFSSVAGPRPGFMNYIDNAAIGIQRRLMDFGDNTVDTGTCGPSGTPTLQQRHDARQRFEENMERGVRELFSPDDSGGRNDHRTSPNSPGGWNH